jgi:hypothetical protein
MAEQNDSGGVSATGPEYTTVAPPERSNDRAIELLNISALTPHYVLIVVKRCGEASCLASVFDDPSVEMVGTY